MTEELIVKQQEYGAVAQLVAHLHGMQGVRGSSPLSSTKKPLEHRDLTVFWRFFFAEIQATRSLAKKAKPAWTKPDARGG